jgi:hypothetical protein
MKCKGCTGDLPKEMLDSESRLCHLCDPKVNREMADNSHIQYLSTNSKERKETPIYSGVFKYFPKTIVAVAQQSQIGHEKHYNKDDPMEYDPSKSPDDADALLRHVLDYLACEKSGDVQGMREAAMAIAWRGWAFSEKILDKCDGVK